MYKLLAFDLDDTLSPAKNKTDKEMASLLSELLKLYKLAIITGGTFPLINNQIIEELPQGSNLENFYILATTGTRMYYYENNEWKLRYAEDLSYSEVEKITGVLNKAIIELDLEPEEVWGEIVENRGSQITYSALGQEAPLEAKKSWDPDFKKRQVIKKHIEGELSEFNVGLGGTTSIDVTRKGIDKAYGIEKIVENLGINKEEILFFGDAIFPGGNDYPVVSTGVDYKKVKDYEDTKGYLREIVGEVRKN